MKNIFKTTCIIILILSSCSLTAQETDKQKKNNITSSVFSASMNCNACEQKIEQTLINMKGIRKVDADHTTGLIEVTFNNKKTNLEGILAELEKIGFKAKHIIME